MNIRGSIYTIIALLLITSPFVLRPYQVIGNSMETTLQANDVVLVDVVSLKFMPLTRGELLVFRNPHRSDGSDVDIKRVIGLPGETVHVRPDRVVIDRACDDTGHAVLPVAAPIQNTDGPCQVTYMKETLFGGMNGGNGNDFDMYLGREDYFVLGDNRRDSSDSRYFGAVQRVNFVGRPILRIAPINHLRVL